jgi:ferredoxin
MIKLKLLRYKCNGCGYCTSLVPELLKISSTDGKVTTFEKNYTNDDEMVLYIDVKTLNDALQTVKICAVKAIVVE